MGFGRFGLSLGFFTGDETLDAARYIWLDVQLAGGLCDIPDRSSGSCDSTGSDGLQSMTGTA